MKKRTISFVLWTSIILCIAYILLLLAPEIKPIKNLNTHMNNISGLLAFSAVLFAALAFIIAVFAYRASVLRPNLKLVIIPELGKPDELVLAVTKKDKMVDITRPKTSWRIWLRNDGDASARYPVVEMKFVGLGFEESNAESPWKTVHHLHGLGYWAGIQWSASSDLVVHPGFPVELPRINFSGRYIHSDKVSVEITVAADGFPAQTTKESIRIEYTEGVYPDYKRIQSHNPSL